MLIVLPVSRNDFNNPLNVFGFIKAVRHFGPYFNHTLLTVTRPSDVEYGKSVHTLVQDLFKKSDFHIFPEDGLTGWPQGPNFYWKETIKHLKNIDNELPWFWMELDALPVKPNWANILEEEYIKADSPCMGTVQDTTALTTDELRIIIARHLQGTAIYPAKLHDYCSIWEYVDRLPKAFDIICQWEIIPVTHNTDLIQQGFHTINYKMHTNPIMIKGEDDGDLGGIIAYDQPLSPEAVIHHGCKDNSLANIVTSPVYKSFLDLHKEQSF
jgi:hypothetical protein